jgi:hypothetical protein
MFTDNKYKVKKTYAQFLEFEAHIVELINKYESTRKKNSKFPLLSGKSHFKTTKSFLPSVSKKSSL